MVNGFEALLNVLPHGSQVAVVTMRGSCCPVTLGHIQGFLESKRILLGECQMPGKLQQFDEVLGMLSLNGDDHVSWKLSQKGEPFISMRDRAELVNLAAADLPWLKFSTGPDREIASMAKLWPHLTFVRFVLNGADDVVRYQKWNHSSESYRLITMGRPGYTQKVLAGMRRAKINPEDGFFIVGPELPDISSTAVRKALRTHDLATLEDLLHPAVCQWCLENGPYKSSKVRKVGAKSCSSSMSAEESKDITHAEHDTLTIQARMPRVPRWRKQA